MTEVKLLVIEDDPCYRTILGLFLKEYTQSITIHQSVENAMEALDKGEKFDVIISDFNLPGKNGAYLAKELRAKGDNTPYIILSANMSLANEEPGIKSVVNKILLKSSVCRDELVATIEAILQKAKENLNILKSPITAAI